MCLASCNFSPSLPTLSGLVGGADSEPTPSGLENGPVDDASDGLEPAYGDDADDALQRARRLIDALNGVDSSLEDAATKEDDPAHAQETPTAEPVAADSQAEEDTLVTL